MIRERYARYYWVAVALFVPFLPYVVRTRHANLDDAMAGLLSAMLALAWAFAKLEGSRKEHTAIEIVSRRKLEGLVRFPPIRPPEIPRQWKTLASLSRPREVFLPFWKGCSMSLSATLVATIFTYLILAASGHPVRLHWWAPSRRESAPFLALAGIAVILQVRYVLQEIRNRSLLRDGELAVGLISGWIARGEGKTVVYQFSTLGGERFEQRRAVYSTKDAELAGGYVPVFYLPEDPSKSAGLCCTQMRIRAPQDDFVARAERLGSRG